MGENMEKQEKLEKQEGQGAPAPPGLKIKVKMPRFVKRYLEFTGSLLVGGGEFLLYAATAAALFGVGVYVVAWAVHLTYPEATWAAQVLGAFQDFAARVGRAVRGV